MAEPPDPPRKFYALKPKEFERVNTGVPNSEEPPAAPTAPDVGPAAADDPGRRIDVHELFQHAGADAPVLGVNSVVNRPNEVHVMLQENHAIADAAGLNEVVPRPRRPSRRKRDFWVLTIGTNTLLLTIYLVEMFLGFQVMCLAARMPQEFGGLIRFALSNPPALILVFAGMIFFTVCWAWLLFGVMDDY